MNNKFKYFFKSSLINKNVHRSYLFSTSVVCRTNFTNTNETKYCYQLVADFYAGKSVFLTGATGFIGRVLIERLLYTCKNIEKVYVLIRAQDDDSLQQRFQNLLLNPIFTKLKETRPEDLHKIIPIAGDVSNDRLGISQTDEQTVIEKVSVIFHSAANVKFRAPLSDLMRANYEGTKHVLELGKKIKHLDVLVHVSTVYNDFVPVVDEILYPHPISIEDTYRVIANHSNEPDEIRKFVGKWGNSYIFSKMMAEAYLGSCHGDTPTIVVRPSMVTSVYKEPIPGYTDSWVTGTVLLCDIASGMARIVPGNEDVELNVIPADYVCNFLIVAAAKNSKTKKCNVYNISNGHSNPINWRKLSKLYIQESKKHGYGVMPFPMAFFTRASWAMPLLIFVTEVIPAFIADTLLRITGKKPRYMKLQKKVTSRTMLSVPITVSTWDVRTTRARELISTLDDQDRLTFPCDPVTIDWDEYVPIYCKGVKDYMIDNKKNK